MGSLCRTQAGGITPVLLASQTSLDGLLPAGPLPKMRVKAGGDRESGGFLAQAPGELRWLALVHRIWVGALFAGHHQLLRTAAAAPQGAGSGSALAHGSWPATPLGHGFERT